MARWGDFGKKHTKTGRFTKFPVEISDFEKAMPTLRETGNLDSLLQV
jgi:hypothetical protein